MEYYIGQIFEDMYPSDAADWCNSNNAKIVEIDPITKEIEEEYEEYNQETGEFETKTRTVEKTFRRFEIQETPEPTVDEKKAQVRSVRDSYINTIEWRVSRYEDQSKLGIETTDSEEVYIGILQYMQYLRDYTKEENWYEQNPVTYEEWLTAHEPVIGE